MEPLAFGGPDTVSVLAVEVALAFDRGVAMAVPAPLAGPTALELPGCALVLGGASCLDSDFGFSISLIRAAGLITGLASPCMPSEVLQFPEA